MKTILEYIWLDGYSTPNLRSKVKVMELNLQPGEIPALKELPVWNFDGSSTQQAPGNNSECLLKPVRIYNWPGTIGHYFIICEVQNVDGTPHKTNMRHDLKELHKTTKGHQFWFGFEQEYFITQNFTPLGFPVGGYPKPQGLYYCGVGGNQVRGRYLVERHLRTCLEMGIELTGTNAEVAVGQWEYQCFARDTLKACDDLWMSRYVLYRLAEEQALDIDISPKPVKGDWNGSGCHTNFSNITMREAGDENYFKTILTNMKIRHDLHIKNYGENNDQRLTGHHETQHINAFSYGIADRGASVRIPIVTANNNWKGYLEDRRPASNCNPYQVAKVIIEATIKQER